MSQAEFIHWPVPPVLHSGQLRKYCDLGKDLMWNYAEMRVEIFYSSSRQRESSSLDCSTHIPYPLTTPPLETT